MTEKHIEVMARGIDVAKTTFLEPASHAHSRHLATAAAAALVEAGYVVVERAALLEVLRISDRKHDAWDKVRAMIEAAEKP